MGLKVSHYSVFSNRSDGHVLAINTLYRTAALIRREDTAELQRILAAPQAYAADPTGKPALFNALRRSLFLVDEDLDEIEFLKMRSLAGQFDSENISIVLMPTLRCNFRCRYCYVTPQNLDMSDDVQQNVLAWLEAKSFRNLLCGWFGGEPLLKLDVMRKMSSAMQTLCQRRNGFYRSTVTTNGYLLTPPVIRELEGLGFTSVQVTLDGPRETHDRMRPLANGQGTFDVLVENICNLLALTHGVALRLRINLDESNVETAYSMIEAWPAEFKDERVLIDPKVIASHPRYWSESESWVQSPGMFRKSLEMLKHLAQQGYRVAFIESLGTSGCTSCEFDFYHNFLIGPEGNLYKCTFSFEIGDRMGHLAPDGKEVLELARMVKRMSAKDPFSDTRCRACQLLPLCGGSCGYRATLGRKRCYLDLYGLQDMAEMFYMEQAMNKKVAASAGQPA